MRNSEAFSMFVLSTTMMETCRDPWRPVLVCQSDFQLFLGAGRKAVSNCNNWSFLDLHFFLSFSLTLYFTPCSCRSVMLLWSCS